MDSANKTGTETLSKGTAAMIKALAPQTSAEKKNVKALVSAAFPEYKGRKVRIRSAASYQMSNFWDGGSRTYVVAVDLVTGRVVEPIAASSNPFSGAANAAFEIPSGVALVEHSFFCGKDAGITIVVNPGTVAGLLPSTAAVLQAVA